MIFHSQRRANSDRRRSAAIPGFLAILAGAMVFSEGCAADAAAQGALQSQPGWVRAGFIVESPPFASSHASTIAESATGLVASWFAGPYEKHPEVAIWVARHDGRRWLPPQQVADGVQRDGSARHPCWNPVLFQPPKGPLILFYKVGPSPSSWWGMRINSSDGGQTWSAPERLPDGILGPVRNKPILLPNGPLLCGSSTEDQGWRLHMEWTADFGQTWEKTAALNDGRSSGLIQPTLLHWPSGRIQALCRSRQGSIYETWAEASWKEWSAPRPISLPNPNSGIDAVMLRDGRALLVYNHTARGRSPLNVALSGDGSNWTQALILEDQPGEYSYPAVIQGGDGLVHIAYTWKRERVKHVVVDPAKLKARLPRPASPP